MKVVLLGMFALSPKGTVSARALPLAQALVDDGHIATVIVPPWDNPAESGKRLVVGGVSVINVRVPRRIPLLWHVIVTYRLLHEIRKARPTVVHVFKPKAHAGLAAMFLSISRRWGRKVRVVVDSDDWEGQGGWNDVERYTWPQKVLFAFQEKWLLRHADAVTVASQELRRIVEALRPKSGTAFYLPNCLRRMAIQAETFAGGDPDRKLAREKDLTVLLYTRFFEFRLQRLVRILQKVFQSVPRARMVVVGRGLFDEDRQFAALCREAGIADRITMVGWVEPASIAGFFAVADLAIYPLDDTLINRAKCPMKLLELAGAGLPIVADRVGQATEYVVDGESGYLVRPEDDVEFSERVIELLQDEGQRRRFGRNAASRVRTRFVWAQWVPVVEDAYACAE